MKLLTFYYPNDMILDLLFWQVAIVGEPQTGKTCLCKQVVSDGTNFLRNYLMTHALDVSVKSINIPDTNDVIEMYLLDCSGR